QFEVMRRDRKNGAGAAVKLARDSGTDCDIDIRLDGDDGLRRGAAAYRLGDGARCGARSPRFGPERDQTGEACAKLWVMDIDDAAGPGVEPAPEAQWLGEKKHPAARR